MNKLAFSINEFSEETSLGRTVLYEQIKLGKLIARKIGKRTVITCKDGMDFINSLPTMANEEVIT